MERPHRSNIYSRWRDLAETSGEAGAHDNQSLDSGAEGPDQQERPEHYSPSGKSHVQTTYTLQDPLEVESI